MAGVGRKVRFHGAFKTKAKAKRKEAKLKNGFIRRIRVRGRTRFVVMSRRRG